jgi:cytochrome P450 monooxygenase
VKVLAETQGLALEIILRVVGVPRADVTEWGKQYRDFAIGFLPIPFDLPGLPRYRSRRARRWLDLRLLEMVRRIRAQPVTSSLISTLCHATDEAGAPLSEDILLANVRGLVLGGHETTATVMAWMVIHLARQPQLWQRLCDEARRHDRLPLTPQEAREYPLAEGLFRESVRWYPPISIVQRKVDQPTTLRGHTLQPGRRLALSMSSLARDPSVFSDPEQFTPERWGGRATSATPQELALFGGGPHFCLGYHLSVFEGTVFAVALAQAMGRAGLRPRLVAGSSPRPVFLYLVHPNPFTQIEFV